MRSGMGNTLLPGCAPRSVAPLTSCMSQFADLLVLTANPLEDIRNTRTIESVILDGRVIDRGSLLPGK